MFHTISQLCETAPKPVVLIIDEVDSKSYKAAVLVKNQFIKGNTLEELILKKFTEHFTEIYGDQYIIEMKIWRDEEYNQRGEEQLTEYLEYYYLDKGYLQASISIKTKPSE